MKISKNLIKELAEEALKEVMAELGKGAPFTNDQYADRAPARDTSLDSPDDDSIEKQFNPSKNDKVLGSNAAKLAQLKGELATVLDRAEREKIITRDENGKVKVLKLPEYQKAIGNLPQEIKALRLKVLGANSGAMTSADLQQDND
jgi:hypothetical protein